MNIQEIKETLKKIFSEDGFKFLNFSFKCPHNLDSTLKKTDDGISIEFTKEMPYVKVKKILIPVTIYVEGLLLGEKGGSVKLKYFPDIHFEYDGFTDEKKFGQQKAENFKIEAFYDEINQKYPDEERRKIARLSLQYAAEWAKILEETKGDVTNFPILEREKLRDNCEKFVLENVKKSKEIKARSAILSFLLFYIVIPSIVNWIIKKFLEHYFRVNKRKENV